MARSNIRWLKFDDWWLCVVLVSEFYPIDKPPVCMHRQRHNMQGYLNKAAIFLEYNTLIGIEFRIYMNRRFVLFGM